MPTIVGAIFAFTPGPVDKKFEQEAMAQLEPLNRELERLLEIKRQLEGQKR